jgi:hypothetical protein
MLGDRGVVVMFGAREGCHLVVCREGDEAALTGALTRLCDSVARSAGVPVEPRKILIRTWMSNLAADLERSRTIDWVDEYNHADDLLDDIPY